jgi:hypothetical protein
MVISALKKQNFYTDVTKLHGYGVAEIKTGEIFKFTGDITRTFKQIN